jgi:hypothetical protein
MLKKYYDKAYPIDKNKLNRNRWMFIKEGIKRGYDIKKIHPQRRIFYVEKNDKGFVYDTLPGSLSARTRLPYIANKFFQKKIMKASGISVAETLGIVKTMDDLKKITCQFPCVIKPIQGSLSQNVFTNIKDEQELNKLVKKVINNKKTEVLIEEMVIGKEYRLLTVNGKLVSCVEKAPASIIGDGMCTVQELIDIKNADPERGAYDSLTHTVHRIAIDDAVKEKLQNENVTLNDVIEKGRVIVIGTNVFVLYGGDFIEKTVEVHKTFVEVSERFTQTHDLFIVGFDVIAKDITKDANKQKYIFNELNEQPFFDVNEKCNIGTGSPVASIMWDEIERDDIMTKKFLLF